MTGTWMNVDLWIWPLDRSAEETAGLAALLSPDEQARAGRFVFDRDRSRYQAARGRLRQVLSGYCGTRADSLWFAYGDHGKPEVPGGPTFNLSHAGGTAALVVAPDAGTDLLGLDIEQFREVEPAVALRFFSARENADLAALPPDTWSAGFFRCWTRKEAMVKALGTGLSLPLDSFDVTLSPDTPARLLAIRKPGEVTRDWSLCHLDLAPDFVGAIAARTPEPMHITLREGQVSVPRHA